MAQKHNFTVVIAAFSVLRNSYRNKRMNVWNNIERDGIKGTGHTHTGKAKSIKGG
jgi:hypothetical protein